MEPILDVKNVTVRFGQRDVLTDISFHVDLGDFIGLVGPNGAGKTTLIRSILGLLPIVKGKIHFFGKPAKSFHDWKKIGFLPQKIASYNPLFPASVEEVVMLGLISKKSYPRRINKEDLKRAEEVLKELGIYDLRKRMLSELSGGQNQKVMLARALISKPDILIFDEPSTALDPESRESFFQLIERLNREKKISIILVTHDTAYVGKYANKLLYVDKTLIYFGKFSDFCQSDQMKSYFGEREQHIICHQHI